MVEKWPSALHWMLLSHHLQKYLLYTLIQLSRYMCRVLPEKNQTRVLELYMHINNVLQEQSTSPYKKTLSLDLELACIVFFITNMSFSVLFSNNYKHMQEKVLTYKREGKKKKKLWGRSATHNHHVETEVVRTMHHSKFGQACPDRNKNWPDPKSTNLCVRDRSKPFLILTDRPICSYFLKYIFYSLLPLCQTSHLFYAK